jgi:hypothetical protein
VLLRAIGPRSETHLKTGMSGLGGVPVERRCTTNAILLHDSTLNEFRKTFCFRETKNADSAVFLNTDGQPNVGLTMNTDNRIWYKIGKDGCGDMVYRSAMALNWIAECLRVGHCAPARQTLT